MRSWNLDKFVDEYGGQAAADVWDVTHQAVSHAIRAERDIQIVLIEGVYEVRESKILRSVKESEVSV